MSLPYLLDPHATTLPVDVLKNDWSGRNNESLDDFAFTKGVNDYKGAQLHHFRRHHKLVADVASSSEDATIGRNSEKVKTRTGYFGYFNSRKFTHFNKRFIGRFQGIFEDSSTLTECNGTVFTTGSFNRFFTVRQKVTFDFRGRRIRNCFRYNCYVTFCVNDCCSVKTPKK